MRPMHLSVAASLARPIAWCIKRSLTWSAAGEAYGFGNPKAMWLEPFQPAYAVHREDACSPHVFGILPETAFWLFPKHSAALLPDQVAMMQKLIPARGRPEPSDWFNIVGPFSPVRGAGSERSQ